MVTNKMIKFSRTNAHTANNLFEIQDLMCKIMTYVDEDEHFRMRAVNHMFQSFFYRITEVCNYRRVLFLSRNRRFPRVTELQIDLHKIPRSTLEFVNPKKFPQLVTVSLSCSQRVTSGDLESLNHPGTQELKVGLSQTEDISAITENKFPELTTLSIFISGFIFVKQPYQPFRIKPHTKLKDVTIDHMFLDESFFHTLTRENFPQLRVLNICEDSCLFLALRSEELKQIFEERGIQLDFLSKTGGFINVERPFPNIL